MIVIISVEESLFLLAVHEVVGGVEVKHQVFGRLGMGSEELIDQYLSDLDQSLMVDAVLEATEGRCGGEGGFGLGRPSGDHLEHGVGAEGPMVVEVLVSQGDGGDALREQDALVVDDESGITGVRDGRVQSVEEADSIGHLPQQEGATVGGEPSALEIGDDGLGATPGKVEGIAVTVCHSDGLGYCGRGSSLIHILQYVRPSRN